MPIKSSRPHTNITALVCIGMLIIAWASNVPAQQPQRIISLAPHLTELAFVGGAGDQLVGVVDYSHWPEQAQQLPSIGDAFRFDMEAILSLQPTLALAWAGGTSEQAALRLSDAGIEVAWIETDTLDAIASAIRQIGLLAGTQDKANQTANSFEKNLDAWPLPNRDQVGGSVPKVFYQISKRPLYTFGKRHVINEVFARCHAQNIFDDMDTHALVVDIESVITRQPDLIISGHEPLSQNSLDDPFSQWTPYLDGALKNTQLHSVDPNLLVRPTPRIIQGIERLCQLVQSAANGTP